MKTKSFALYIFIKAVLPSLFCIFFLWLMVSGTKTEKEKTNEKVYNFNPREISKVNGIGVQEFEASMATMSDSVFLFCSNEDEKCYQMLVDLHSLGKDEIEYLNVLELVDSEKELLKKYDIFNDSLYPKLIIIKNNKYNYYSKYLTKEELDKIL